ncbi:MAG: hypothetical protein IJ633_08300 [Prevotella sp.]|nr:hypothetical protein [Prevotella sp.]
MRKFLLFCGMFLLSMTVMAEGTEPEKINATELSSITFEGDKVILHYKNGTTTTVDDMETIVIDLTNASGIETVRQIEALRSKGVYNLQGQYLGQGVGNLKKGVYVVDGKKVIIK